MTAVVLMGKDDARALTDALRERVQSHGKERESILAALVEAEAVEAWRALGYASMARYVSVEFGYSRSNAYNILDQYKQAKRLEVSSAGQLPPQRESAAARQEHAPMLNQKRAKRGPPSLTGWLEDFRNDVERLQGALDMSEGDPFEYMDVQTKRDLERTADKCFTFWGGLIDKLAIPAAVRAISASAASDAARMREQDEWGAA